MALRCLYIVYACNLFNDAVSVDEMNSAGEPLSFDEAFPAKFGQILQLETIMLACEIVGLQLRFVAAHGTSLSEDTLDVVPLEMLRLIGQNLELAPRVVRQVMNDLSLTIVA